MSKKFDWSKTADNWTASTSIAPQAWGPKMTLSDINRHRSAAASRDRQHAAAANRMRRKGGSRSDAVRKAWITRRRGTSGKNK